MVSWSTDTVNERERFSYWREVVCRSLFNVSTETLPQNFSGKMRTRASGSLRFLMSESSSYQFIRTKRDISSAPSDHYTILMQMRGQTAITESDNQFVCQRNDIALFDGRQAFNARNSQDGRRVAAVVPHALINARAPWLQERSLHRLPSNSRFLDLARRHMVRLISRELDENATALLTENLCNLIALASAPDIPMNSLQPELQIEALLAFCRQNMRDPRLSPQFVAGHLGFSVRTLHSRFEKIGQTFGSWLLERRLDECCKALRDPSQLTRNISEIAYTCGFNDLSYFNKAFRARFGMPPREWRYVFMTRH